MKFLVTSFWLCFVVIGFSQKKTTLKGYKYKEVNISETHHPEADLSFLNLYSKGIHHYNEAVADVRRYSNKKLVTVEDLKGKNKFIEEKFRLALPYLEQAYEINPHDRSTLEALAGIYFALNDSEKFNQFSDEVKKLK